MPQTVRAEPVRVSNNYQSAQPVLMSNSYTQGVVTNTQPVVLSNNYMQTNRTSVLGTSGVTN